MIESQLKKNIDQKKRLTNSNSNKLFSKISKINFLLPVVNCILCQKHISLYELPNIVNKALYRRYCSSINYFYSRDINKIITGVNSSVLIKYKELFVYDEQKEWLKRNYTNQDGKIKFKAIMNYDEFHYYRPRIHVRNIQELLTKYYKNKKKIIEKDAKKKLESQAKNLGLHGLNACSQKNLHLKLDRLKNVEDKSQIVEPLNQCAIGNRILSDLDNDKTYQNILEKEVQNRLHSTQQENLKLLNENLRLAIQNNINDKNSCRVTKMDNLNEKNSFSAASVFKEKMSEMFSMDFSRRPSVQILFDPDNEMTKSFYELAPILQTICDNNNTTSYNKKNDNYNLVNFSTKNDSNSTNDSLKYKKLYQCSNASKEEKSINIGGDSPFKGNTSRQNHLYNSRITPILQNYKSSHINEKMDENKLHIYNETIKNLKNNEFTQPPKYLNNINMNSPNTSDKINLDQQKTQIQLNFPLAKQILVKKNQPNTMSPQSVKLNFQDKIMKKINPDKNSNQINIISLDEKYHKRYPSKGNSRENSISLSKDVLKKKFEIKTDSEIFSPTNLKLSNKCQSTKTIQFDHTKILPKKNIEHKQQPAKKYRDVVSSAKKIRTRKLENEPDSGNTFQFQAGGQNSKDLRRVESMITFQLYKSHVSINSPNIDISKVASTKNLIIDDLKTNFGNGNSAHVLSLSKEKFVKKDVKKLDGQGSLRSSIVSPTNASHCKPKSVLQKKIEMKTSNISSENYHSVNSKSQLGGKSIKSPVGKDKKTHNLNLVSDYLKKNGIQYSEMINLKSNTKRYQNTKDSTNNQSENQLNIKNIYAKFKAKNEILSQYTSIKK